MNKNNKKVNVLTGNKLIAEFMGFEYIPYVKGQTQSPGWWHKNSSNIIKGKMSSATKLSKDYFLRRRHCELRYYNEWNWIMPVVEKIESIKDKHHGYFGVYINSNSCTIQGTNLRTDIKQDPPIYYSNFVLEDKLKSTYKAVIEFIKWYNNEKS